MTMKSTNSSETKLAFEGSKMADLLGNLLSNSYADFKHTHKKYTAYNNE